MYCNTKTTDISSPFRGWGGVKAEQELGAGWTLMKQFHDGVPSLEEWLAAPVGDPDASVDVSAGGAGGARPRPRRVAVDPFCVSKAMAEKWQTALAKVGGELVATPGLIDELWVDRQVEIPLATDNLLEDTGGLFRPPSDRHPLSTGDEAIHQGPLGAAGCCVRLLLTCALLMTSSHLKASRDLVGHLCS